MAKLGGVQSWCSGTVPEHGSLGAVTWLRSLFIYPTLRIRAGCQCPRRTRSWPSYRELTGTGSRFFSVAPRQCTVLYPSATLLFQWCLTGRNWANMGETEQICTQWYRVPKVWTMPFWAGSLAQSSSRYRVWTSPYSLNLIINRI